MHSPYFYQNQVLNLEFLLTHSDLSKCNHWNKYKTATRSHSGHPQLTLISTHCILSTGLICMNQSILSTTYEVGSTGAPFLQVSTSSSISKRQSQDVYLGFVLGGPALALLSHARHYLRTPPSAWERPGSWPHQPSPGTPAMRKPPPPRLQLRWACRISTPPPRQCPRGSAPLPVSARSASRTNRRIGKDIRAHHVVVLQAGRSFLSAAGRYALLLHRNPYRVPEPCSHQALHFLRLSGREKACSPLLWQKLQDGVYAKKEGSNLTPRLSASSINTTSWY